MGYLINKARSVLRRRHGEVRGYGEARQHGTCGRLRGEEGRGALRGSRMPTIKYASMHHAQKTMLYAETLISSAVVLLIR